MGRNSCCPKQKLRKGLWSPEEDEKLYNYITRFGVGCWSSVPKLAGLQRCGKSCRLRWINYLRPDLKRGMFSQEEEDLILNLHEALGNRWAQIAAQLPGRTDNEIKNFWNSSLKKKLIKQGIDPNTHKPIITQTHDKDSHILQPKGLPNLATYNFASKQVYDPLFLPEFQANVDPHLYQSNFLSHCQQEQNQIEGNIVNSACGFDSMPNLTNILDTECCDISGSSQARTIQMNNNNVESASTFSWDVENKLDSMFQLQFMSQELTGANLDVFQQI